MFIHSMSKKVSSLVQELKTFIIKFKTMRLFYPFQIQIKNQKFKLKRTSINLNLNKMMKVMKFQKSKKVKTYNKKMQIIKLN